MSGTLIRPALPDPHSLRHGKIVRTRTIRYTDILSVPIGITHGTTSAVKNINTAQLVFFFSINRVARFFGSDVTGRPVANPERTPFALGNLAGIFGIERDTVLLRS